jgi:hypothetical protein
MSRAVQGCCHCWPDCSESEYSCLHLGGQFCKPPCMACALRAELGITSCIPLHCTILEYIFLEKNNLLHRRIQRPQYVARGWAVRICKHGPAGTCISTVGRGFQTNCFLRNQNVYAAVPPAHPIPWTAPACYVRRNIGTTWIPLPHPHCCVTAPSERERSKVAEEGDDTAHLLSVDTQTSDDTSVGVAMRTQLRQGFTLQ